MVLGGRSGWYFFLNERHYVYDPFDHWKVIAQPQALNLKIKEWLMLLSNMECLFVNVF